MSGMTQVQAAAYAEARKFREERQAATKEAVRRLLERDPELTAQTVAVRVGVSANTVRRIRAELLPRRER